MPFAVKNTSNILPMSNVILTCGVDLATFADASGHRLGSTGLIMDSDATVAAIPPGETINYPCNASGALRAQADGTVEGGGLTTRAGVVTSDLTVESMCVWIKATYQTVWFRRRYVSQMFEWIQTPTGHQWLEGPLVSAQKTNIVQTCRPRPKPPFARFHTGGLPTLELTF